MTKRRMIIDSTQLTTWMECPLKGKMRFMDNLVPKAPVTAMSIGSLIHSGLEYYYKGLLNDYSKPDAAAGAVEYVKMLSMGVAVGLEIKEGVIEIVDKPDAKSVKVDPDDAITALTALVDSLEYHRDEEIKPLAVEEPHLFKVYDSDNLEAYYACKIDLVVQDLRTLEVSPMDHKSRSRARELSRRSNQFISYTMAVGSNKMIVNPIGLQKTLKAAEKFKREEIYIPDVYKQNWLDNAVIPWVKLIDIFVQTGTFPENLSSCDKFSGCMFKKICDAVTPEAAEHHKEMDYEVTKPWDVSGAKTDD